MRVERKPLQVIHYLIENLRWSIDRLCLINNEIKKYKNDIKQSSMQDIIARWGNGNRIRELSKENRVLTDYIIMRTYCLFDKHEKSVSLYNLLNKQLIKKIQDSPIIKCITENRGSWVGHINRFVNPKRGIMQAPEICNSNLGQILKKIEEICFSRK